MKLNCRRFLVIVSALAAVLLAPGLANATECEEYSEVAALIEIDEALTQIHGAMPSRYSAAISNIKISYSASSASGGGASLPSAVFPLDGSDPYIEISSDFLILQCMMIHWTSHIFELDEDMISSVVTWFSAHKWQCREKNISDEMCFNEMMKMESEIPTNNKERHKDKKYYKKLIKDSLFFVLAHEVSHILLARERSIFGGRLSADEELQADYMAQMAAMFYGRDFRANIYLMMPLQFFSDSAQQSDERQHPSPRCRAAVSLQISRRLVPKIHTAMEWPRGEKSAETFTARADSMQRMLDIPSLFKASELDACPRLSFRYVDRLANDYGSLLAAMDKASMSTDGGSGLDSVQMMLKHVPETPEVRGVLGSLIILRLSVIERRYYEAGNNAGRVRINEMFTLVEGKYKMDDVNSTAFGLFHLMAATNSFDLAPPGTNLDYLVKVTERRLSIANQHLSDWPYIHVRRGQMAFLRGDCDEGRRLFALAQSSSSRPQTPSGDFAPFAKSLDNGSCEIEARNLRSKMRQERQWN